MKRTIGARDLLSFDLHQEDTGQLEIRAWVGARCAWGTAGGVRGLVADWLTLVDHLSHFWLRLHWEEGFPLGLSPRSARNLWADAERLLADADGISDQAQGELASFRLAHNLASAFDDVRLPSLWLVRQGNLIFVAGPNNADAELHVDDALGSLAALAEQILAHASPGERRERSSELWKNRGTATTGDLLQLYTGLADETLNELQGAASFEQAWETPADDFQPTEIMAAARATANLSAEVQAQLLKRVRDTGPRPSTELDEWASTARKATRGALEPWRQGYFAAQAIREHHATHRTDPIDIEHELRRLNVEVAEFRIPSRQVDAFAVWGPRHGPLVLWNPEGLCSSDPEGRMATLAHELGHLLIDREGALPLLELLRGRTPEKHEQRARAFAAELLLPQSVARTRFDGVELDAARRAFATIQKHYRVSAELAAWQVINSGAKIGPQVRRLLRSCVSSPAAFDQAATSGAARSAAKDSFERLGRDQEEEDGEFARLAGRRAMRLVEW